MQPHRLGSRGTRHLHLHSSPASSLSSPILQLSCALRLGLRLIVAIRVRSARLEGQGKMPGGRLLILFPKWALIGVHQKTERIFSSSFLKHQAVLSPSCFLLGGKVGLHPTDNVSHCVQHSLSLVVGGPLHQQVGPHLCVIGGVTHRPDTQPTEENSCATTFLLHPSVIGPALPHQPGQHVNPICRWRQHIVQEDLLCPGKLRVRQRWMRLFRRSSWSDDMVLLLLSTALRLLLLIIIGLHGGRRLRSHRHSTQDVLQVVVQEHPSHLQTEEHLPHIGVRSRFEAELLSEFLGKLDRSLARVHRGRVNLLGHVSEGCSHNKYLLIQLGLLLARLRVLPKIDSLGRLLDTIHDENFRMVLQAKSALPIASAAGMAAVAVPADPALQGTIRRTMARSVAIETK
mmetsp:Transcript_44409/g.100177  ORF Transcript_44409/g.100177 Transcript_44409/m.100177 type:complete len:401 (-) Transcript_44409:477-1679(-)